MCTRPVSGDASEAEIGEDEVVVPVTEEEVVVSKRPVAKEEVGLRSDPDLQQKLHWVSRELRPSSQCFRQRSPVCAMHSLCPTAIVY